MRGGRIERRGGSSDVPVADVLRQAGASELVGEGTFALPGGAPFEGDGKGTPYSMRTFGVIFVEVGVDRRAQVSCASGAPSAATAPDGSSTHGPLGRK